MATMQNIPVVIGTVTIASPIRFLFVPSKLSCTHEYICYTHDFFLLFLCLFRTLVDFKLPPQQTCISNDTAMTDTQSHNAIPQNNTMQHDRPPNDEQQHAPEPVPPADEAAGTTSFSSTRTILPDSRSDPRPSSSPPFPSSDPWSSSTLSENSARKKRENERKRQWFATRRGCFLWISFGCCFVQSIENRSIDGTCRQRERNEPRDLLY